jgi:nucleotide-binding universal stress UspA family protein
MRKMLIGIHDKYCSMRAIEYVGKQFPGANDLELTVVHVLPNLPAIFWDEGHFLSEAEKQDRQKVIDSWLAKQKEKIDPILKSAVDGLVRKGFKPEQVKTKFISDSTDVADSLLEEAKDGGYQTIILGRCGIQEGKHLLVGSVTSKIIHKAAGVAICVVE